MATPNPPDIISEIRSQLKEQEALEAVAAAYSLPVLYSLKSLVCFGGLDEDVALSCPAPGFVLNFNNGDYLHIKREYTNDWLIGRIVGSDISLGFIPSEKLLLSVVERRTPFSEAENDNPNTIIQVYQKAPIVRPIVFVGPSLKTYELTKMLQGALVDVLKRQFSDRLVVIRLEKSLSLLAPKEAYKLKNEIYDAGRNQQLIYLDCCASLPSEVAILDIHPMIIYIQISQYKVLRKLVFETCNGKSKRQSCIEGARKLYDLPREQFSLVITDSCLADASLNLELFIESYWASTHPPSINY